jgi:1-aminocyclopropane-1-carboxylate deaminase/D-cysteine desulfhydrase-like pyridoxal-dependent ACC family enzyme
VEELYRDATPIEEHHIGRRLVFVKRDDLYGVPPAPPLGKLRGLRRLLRHEYSAGVRLVGCWDTHVSKLGQGVAAECNSLGHMRCIVAFSAKAADPVPIQFTQAATLGAELLRLKPNHVDICFAQARKAVSARGGVMLPFGLESSDAVDAIADEAAQVPREYTERGTVVLCCGSGVTVSGLIRGLRGHPRRFVGISSGRSVERIARCIRRFVGGVPTNLDLIPAELPYAAVPDATCPFPAHPNYDLKSWVYLERNISKYQPGPILFWNIGS